MSRQMEGEIGPNVPAEAAGLRRMKRLAGSLDRAASPYDVTSLDVMSKVIMKPLVPLYSNAFGPTR